MVQEAVENATCTQCLGDVHESVSVPVNLGLRKNNSNFVKH